MNTVVSCLQFLVTPIQPVFWFAVCCGLVSGLVAFYVSVAKHYGYIGAIFAIATEIQLSIEPLRHRFWAYYYNVPLKMVPYLPSNVNAGRLVYVLETAEQDISTDELQQSIIHYTINGAKYSLVHAGDATVTDCIVQAADLDKLRSPARFINLAMLVFYNEKGKQRSINVTHKLRQLFGPLCDFHAGTHKALANILPYLALDPVDEVNISYNDPDRVVELWVNWNNDANVAKSYSKRIDLHLNCADAMIDFAKRINDTMIEYETTPCVWREDDVDHDHNNKHNVAMTITHIAGH
jgi:hypothetical protein